MSLKDTFCSSPWIHMKILHDGSYGKCRWGWSDFGEITNGEDNIKKTDPIVFFQKKMAPFRKELLKGISQKTCSECYQVDRYQKISGRQRQLLKAGIQLDQFEKTALSSPMLDFFKKEDGGTDLRPIDWQIDLGNYCNSSCVFCHPYSSSTLATEFKKLGLISELPPRTWSEDQELVDKFINALVSTEHLSYLHFLGGETLITPAFKKMLVALIDNGLNEKLSIGFTTNLTVWREDILDLLSKFKMVNLGMSIESLNKINDYVRYPSQIENVRMILDKWVKVGQDKNWLLQLRITPTLLTINDLSSVYDYAYNNGIAVESCNFLTNPEFLRPTVLPKKYINEAIDKLKNWITDKKVSSEKVINTRNPAYAKEQVIQDAESYVNYLETAPNETDRARDLVEFLKKIESNRNNSILDYLPDYEDFLRTAGY